MSLHVLGLVLKYRTYTSLYRTLFTTLSTIKKLFFNLLTGSFSTQSTRLITEATSLLKINNIKETL